MNYEIFTDSAANLTHELVQEYNVNVIPIEYIIDGTAYPGHRNSSDDTWIKEIYSFLRNKQTITTSCINAETLENAFLPVLQSGSDLIYICFSSGLSKTYDIAKEVCDKLKNDFPDRKIYLVDSRAASFGQGLLVDYAGRQKLEGKSIDEVYNWQEENKQNLAHWFTVDDLFFLKRGGRISAATAIAGTMLGIKPILHVDEDGHLINVDKVRGRKAALTELVNRMCETGIAVQNQRIFLAHGDCADEAAFVEDLIYQRTKAKDITTTFINPIIGSHSGPGTMALFFIASKK